VGKQHSAHAVPFTERAVQGGMKTREGGSHDKKAERELSEENIKKKRTLKRKVSRANQPDPAKASTLRGHQNRGGVGHVQVIGKERAGREKKLGDKGKGGVNKDPIGLCSSGRVWLKTEL